MKQPVYINDMEDNEEDLETPTGENLFSSIQVIRPLLLILHLDCNHFYLARFCPNLFFVCYFSVLLLTFLLLSTRCVIPGVWYLLLLQVWMYANEILSIANRHIREKTKTYFEHWRKEIMEITPDRSFLGWHSNLTSNMASVFLVAKFYSILYRMSSQ